MGVRAWSEKATAGSEEGITCIGCMYGTGKNVILFRARTGEVVGGFAVITKATLEVDFDFLSVASDMEALMCVDAHRFRFA